MSTTPRISNLSLPLYARQQIAHRDVRQPWAPLATAAVAHYVRGTYRLAWSLPPLSTPPVARRHLTLSRALTDTLLSDFATAAAIRAAEEERSDELALLQGRAGQEPLPLRLTTKGSVERIDTHVQPRHPLLCALMTSYVTWAESFDDLPTPKTAANEIEKFARVWIAQFRLSQRRAA